MSVCLGEGRGEGKSVLWLVHMLMPLHWSLEVAETFPGLPSTPALKFSRGELNWQNSIPLRTSGTTGRSSASGFAWVFFSARCMGYRKAAEVGLLPAAQLSTAQHLGLCLMVLPLLARKEGTKWMGAY